ncbi:DUF7527 domain-containing protein [Salinibaculum marinum]|uniref:DUF7527 domain-containing protein n=1 Tax=Salinibaculum marinum TaxID=3131993 RepID=UPI0030CAAE44
MQERSEEVRAQYYTEETPVSEVDRTLEDGGFTGFVELSENVLSGDYYLVYHRGRSMSVAFVGNSKRLIEGDEAFEQADDEVGIYEVKPVSIDAIEIPEVEEPAADPSGGAIAEAEPDDGEESAADAETTVETEPVAADEPPETDDGDEPAATDSPDDAPAADADAPPTSESSEGPVSDRSPEPSEPADPANAQSDPNGDEVPASGEGVDRDDRKPEPATGEPSSPPESRDTDVATEPPGEPSRQGTTPEPRSSSETGPVGTDPDTSNRQASTGQQPTPGGEPSPQPSTAGRSPGRESGQAADQVGAPTDARPAPGSPDDLEMKAIPSLDPERSETVRGSQAGSEAGQRGDAPGRGREESRDRAPEQSRDSGRADDTATREEPQQPQRQSRQHQSTPGDAPSTDSPGSDGETAEQSTAESSAEPTQEDSEEVETLRSELAERRAEIERLESDLQAATDARDEARANLATVQEERDELEREVERLESELRRLEEELGAKTDAERRITPQEALQGTDLFVRYRSKGESTLQKAHDSGQRREDVTDNLRLEKHTQFDAAAASVGGQAYDQFLEETVEYSFVKWVVEDLLFEIQSTGHTETLQDLYDALPEINRIELNGVVTTTDAEENERQETFDLVFRARMGDPLLVANINDSRQGASEAMMESLITAAERVGRTSDAFAAAFLVTQSFFEPEALETVADATRGGLLSRDKRKSFVNLSRKRGYHLCLVEARNENFHLKCRNSAFDFRHTLDFHALELLDDVVDFSV